MLRAIPIEVLLAAGYALFLMIVAVALEWLARRSHQRSEQYELAGFKFHADVDRWECPTGQHLHRSEVEHDQRIIRYKAPAHACNACHIKTNCTDSETGREIEHHLDSWLTSEIRRFHNGISLALLTLAALLLGIEAVRFPHPPAVFILAVLFLPIGIAVFRLASSLRFPAT